MNATVRLLVAGPGLDGELLPEDVGDVLGPVVHTSRMTSDGLFSSVDLPDPANVLADTDWAALEHALGSAADAPAMLAALLEADQSIRTKALRYLYGTLHHGNTLYDATVPTARYVAAILSDPRTTRAVNKEEHAFPGCLRAELLTWIASIAGEVTDEAEGLYRRTAYPLHDWPPAVAVQGLRPLLFSASVPYTEDADRHVREAALAACIPLLDDPRSLHHRQPLAPLVRRDLGTSEFWQRRALAVDTLNAWGEDTSGLERPQDPDLSWADGCSEEPPFRPGPFRSDLWL
ncbi:hypothetical protein [Streptomyces mexicanus]|uniref:hypothetical protein n=1 Tax=Streptomyces mexicanus TaxID=178566 RepID=UPI00369E8A61